MNHELYIEPERPKYNPKNGQFLPGHTPANKGKKWSEWMSKRGQRRSKKGWKNLRKYQPRSPYAGRNKKPIIAVLDDGSWYYFPYSEPAARIVNGNRENVGRCCRYNQERHINRKTGKVNTDHKYMGVRFYFESDNIWTKKIKQQ